SCAATASPRPPPGPRSGDRRRQTPRRRAPPLPHTRTRERRSRAGAGSTGARTSVRDLHGADVAGGALRPRDAALIHRGEGEPVGDEALQVLLTLERVA